MFAISLKNYFNSQFIADLMVGSPEQAIPVLLDTGSPDVWIISDDCVENTCKLVDTRFYEDKSESFEEIGSEKNISDRYGSGTIWGKEVQDTIRLDNLTINKMPFCSIKEVDFDNQDYLKFSGLVGLSYSSLSKYTEISFVKQMGLNGLIDYEIFAFYLSTEGESEFTIGYVDLTKTKSNLMYYEVILREWWTISVSSVTLGGEGKNLCESVSCPAIIDSGTSLITMPFHLYKSVLK